MDPTLKPMLCGKAPEPPEGPNWILEGKLDGWRGIAHLDAQTPEVQLYGGRNGNSYTGKLPYIEEALWDCLPRDTAVDGELIGAGWGDVQGVMTRGAGAHVPSEAIPALTYVVFDILRCDGTDTRALPWTERRKLLEVVDWPEGILLSPYGPSTQAAHEEMIALGLEGTVSKRSDGRYVNGRSNLWIKCKPQTSDEAKIVGFKAGEKGGQFDGMVGAFEVEMLDSGAPTTVKCGTVERHRDATEHPENWRGVVIEIKHHGLGKTGVPRHPQFFRRRDDRVADDQAPKQKAPRTRRTSMSTPATGATGRMRNYGAMGDEKLLRCIKELQAGAGEAHERALTGSGDPAKDLDTALAIAETRGI